MKPKDFIRNTLKYALPTGVSAVVSIAVIPLITRIYPTEEYGIISLYYSIGTLLSSVLTLGLSSACVRFFFEPHRGTTNKQAFNLAFFTGLFITILIASLILLFGHEKVCNYLFGEGNITALILFGIYTISNIAYKLQSNYTRLSQNPLAYNVQQILFILVNRVLFILAVIYSTDYFYSILLMTLFTALEVLFVGRRYYKPDFHFPDMEGNIKYLKFSLPLLPNDIAVVLNNSAAKFLLSFYGDFSSLGIISMGTNLANTFNLFTGAFGTYWSPFMYENYRKEQKMIRNIHNYCLLLSILLVCGILIFQDVLYILLGQEYRVSQQYFMLIMLLPIQILISETTSYGINISQKTYITMIISIISCIINMGIGYFLYPVIGALAMALGIATSAILQIILKTIMGQRFYKSIKSGWQTIFGIAIILIVCILNTWIYRSFSIRALVGTIVLVLSCIIFRKEVSYIFNLVISFLRVHIKRYTHKEREN